MNRRPRRSGINFIENDKDRSVTFFKRRSGLHKAANDLSSFTGAKVAIVVESESGKVSSFGTPSANRIIEAFLSGRAPADPPADDPETARITELQDELYQLDKERLVMEKRAKQSKPRFKKIEETSSVRKLLDNDVEDLSADELRELLRGLVQLGEGVNAQVNTNSQVKVSGQGGPSLPFSSSSSRLSSQVNMPPRHLPLAPLHASSQRPQSSWERFLPSSISRSSLLPPAIPPMHHQAQMLPVPVPPGNEAHRYSYYFPQEQPPRQVDLAPNHAYADNVDYLNPVAPPAQKHASYTDNFNLNPVAAPQLDQNDANSNDLAADGQPPDAYRWAPASPGNQEYHSYLRGLCVELELTDDSGDQAAAAAAGGGGGGDQENVPDRADDGMNQQADEMADDDWLNMSLWDFSTFPGDNPGGAAGNN